MNALENRNNLPIYNYVVINHCPTLPHTLYPLPPTPPPLPEQGYYLESAIKAAPEMMDSRLSSSVFLFQTL
jgi:hypothetical protein